MRKIPLLFSLIVALVLCACTNSKQPVSSSGSNDLGQEVLDVPQTPSIEITFEDMHVYQNALGDTCATYLARLENTSDTAVAITDTSIDIEKPDGTLLTSTDFFSVYPRVVQVGESAYICSDVIFFYFLSLPIKSEPLFCIITWNPVPIQRLFLLK